MLELEEKREVRGCKWKERKIVTGFE